jgi:putative hemolysin
MELLVIFILILLNGFFALSEIALVSSKKSRLEQLRREGRRGAGTALRLLDDSESFLSAVQVGITFIGIVTGVYGGISIADHITPFFQKFEILRNSAEEISLTITVLTITYFSIVIGELVPKTIALSNPEKIAVRIAPTIFRFSIVFYPVVKFLSFSTSLINRLIGIEKHTDHITEAELRHLLKTASKEGVIEKYENLIHEKVFYFSDKKAKHIMTHRMEVDWVDMHQPLHVINETILRSKHSRLVCSKGNLDDFQGIFNVRDFLIAYPSNKVFSISGILLQPLIVPESAEVQVILKQFKQNKIHFCIVVNRWQSQGIITPHDILENLIGSILRRRTVQPDIFVRDDKSFLVSGDAPAEIRRYFDAMLPTLKILIIQQFAVVIKHRQITQIESLHLTATLLKL